MDNQEEQMYQAMFEMYQSPNPESVGVAHMIETIYPALARKIFASGDKLVKHFAMTKYNPLKLMNMPLCGKCEALAYRDEDVLKDGVKVETCRCMQCGTLTLRPVKFRDWLKDELRGKMPKGSEKQLDGNFVDAQAMVQVSRAMREYMRLNALVSPEKNERMGLVEETTGVVSQSAFPNPKVVHLTSEEAEHRRPELAGYFQKREAK